MERKVLKNRKKIFSEEYINIITIINIYYLVKFIFFQRSI